MSKPDGYPLPWCEALDLPYYKINLYLCLDEKWSKFQSRKPMSYIISYIDEKVLNNELDFLRP